MTKEMKKIAKETNAALATLNTTPPDMQLFFMYRSTGGEFDPFLGGYALRGQICLHPDTSVGVISGGYKNDVVNVWKDVRIASIARTCAHEMGKYRIEYSLLDVSLFGKSLTMQKRALGGL